MVNEVMCVYIYDFINISFIIFAQCFSNLSHVIDCLSLLGYWSYPNEIDCCALLLNYKNLKFDLLLYGVKYLMAFDLLLYGVKYLMALEYLVSLQRENLNLMEVEDY